MNMLLQIDPFLISLSRFGLLGILLVVASYVIYYLFNKNKELAETLIKNALDTAKQDHEENKDLIEKLRIETVENLKQVELERKAEREKFYEIINKFQTVVEDNTEVLKAIKDKF